MTQLNWIKQTYDSIIIDTSSDASNQSHWGKTIRQSLCVVIA